MEPPQRWTRPTPAVPISVSILTVPVNHSRRPEDTATDARWSLTVCEHEYMFTLVTGRPNLLRGEILARQPVQARSRENRQRIRAAALVCFRNLGYNATTLEEIATRSGVAVGGIYLHYKSKRQLLLALMDELLEALANVPLALDRGHPREMIRTLLRRAFDRDLEFLGAYRAWQEAVLSDPALARQDAAIHRWTRQRVARTFTALQRLPGARRGVNIETLAAVMDRLFWQLLAEALRTRAAGFDRWLDAASDVTFHALFEDRKQRTR